MSGLKLVWYKPIEGYDKYYVEGISGSIYSTEYRHRKQNHILKPFYIHPNKEKYLGVNLWKKGKQGRVIPVHRIIANAFPEICGDWFKGAVVNHKDENPENNSCLNLEWCSVAYNNAYGTGNEKRTKTIINKYGEDSKALFFYKK